MSANIASNLLSIDLLSTNVYFPKWAFFTQLFSYPQTPHFNDIYFIMKQFKIPFFLILSSIKLKNISNVNFVGTFSKD